MILEIVTFNTPGDWDRAQLLADAKATIPRWSANRELVRKHFGRGLGADDGTAAGVYVWPSIEAAQRGHDETWRNNVRARTGSEPTIRYFDLFLLIDNEHGRVVEYAEDGTPRALQTA